MRESFKLISALLAGAMACSLTACALSGGAPASGGSTAQTSAVSQGRWVEQQAQGIPQGVYLSAPPIALADGTLVLYGRDETAQAAPTLRMTSADNGATWKSEQTDWSERAGILATWAARPDGTVAFITTESALWLAKPDGSLTQLDLSTAVGGSCVLNQMCFLPDGTLAIVPTAEGGDALPGNILFYDVEAQTTKAWVQVPSDGQNWGGAGVNRDGETVYFGSNDIVGILPAEDENGAFLYYFSYDGDLCRADLDSTTRTVQAGFFSDPYTIKIAMGADNAICYADSTGIYRQAQGGGLTEQVLDSTGTALSLQSNYIADLGCAPDGSYLVVVNSQNTSRLYRYAFDASLSAPSETLNVWSLEDNATVRAAIQAFTQENPDCAVEYEAARQQDSTLTNEDLLRTLNTELLAGDGPDVLILDGADLDAFADSGLLTDLSGAVNTDALYDFITEDYVRGDGSIPVLPARFSVPLMHGMSGTLDGVSTLDDVAALVKQYPPRPGELSWAPLEESQRYALGFDSVDSLVRFALQASQPALLEAGGLNAENLRSLLDFVQTVGSYYGMANYPEADTAAGAAGNFGGVDTVSWDAGMGEYAQTSRAVFGYGTMTTPAWLGATGPGLNAVNHQTILQPGLSRGVYLPGCMTAVSADSDQPELALAFVSALLSDPVQGGYQYDGMPVTRAGMQAFMDRNLEVMQENGYTGGFEELLDQLDTPVVLDDALLNSLTDHSTALIAGSETLDQAVANVESDLALRFAEQG